MIIEKARIILILQVQDTPPTFWPKRGIFLPNFFSNIHFASAFAQSVQIPNLDFKKFQVLWHQAKTEKYHHHPVINIF